ncbi:3-oxoacyl-[acyl-carrier-protein] synthase III C-terminal domain-containing protein [Paraburkholderia sp. ZP32-5]|uniref:3-oxoacyl-[acyl-carrier-protein] synthase III C-terminal domain-containing protein n=1 Tax=Paraburkholderia sp. ZP32-5 TaxID=2883245 RepID=UPI001F3A34E0|nr:3-oxoacyl-[acyl-carrier-protein] synthase III C-terminal domain-containing protein [Paraburkholderia sp. ZP32-5]
MNRNSTRGIRICGTGTAVPANTLTSEEIDRRFGLPVGTIFARYGVRTRHYARNENAATLAVEACEQALQRAGFDWSDIDCLVASSATMDQALPYNAAMILAAVGPGVGHISAFDIGASCLSFLVGLDTISYLVECGRYRNVMVVSSDIATFSLDWTTLGESAIFGDGAAAAIIRKSEPGERSCILASQIETHASGANDCHIKAGGSRYHPRRPGVDFGPLTFFHMDGPRLFRTVSRELPRLVSQLLDGAALTLEQIRLVIPHQASRLALDHLSKRLRIEPARVMDILAESGNQVGASLPSALHRAIEDSRIKRDEPLMLLGSGAGLTLGGMVLVY